MSGFRFLSEKPLLLVLNVDEYCLLTIIFHAKISVGAVKYYSDVTISGIATQFGVTVDEIVKTNNIADPNRIREGDELLIPVHSSGGPPVPAQSPTKVP